MSMPCLIALILISLLVFAWWGARKRAFHTVLALELCHQKLEHAQRRLDDLQKSLQRTQKRIPIERQDAQQEVIAQLLPVDQEISLALRHAEYPQSSVRDLKKGLELCIHNLNRIWTTLNVQRIHPKDGEPFDPQIHQAISTEIDPHIDQPTISTVHQDGFCFHNHLVQPALVHVKMPQSSDGEEKSPRPFFDDHDES